jgi:alpha-L-fucosidase
LMRFYYESAGQGAVMLLNSTPNTDGLIPEGDVKLYQALGQEIERRFGKPLAETRGRGETLELDFGKPTLVNHAVIMEDYRQGERIRRYALDGFDGKAWKPLSEGGHVGRKRIDCFQDAVVLKLRLRVIQSAAEPLVRSFQAFLTAAAGR